jgi:hypothetical protein
LLVRTIALLVAIFVLLAGVVIAARLGVYYLSDPPMIEVKLVRGIDLGEPAARDSDRSETPAATLVSHLQSPDHFVIRGYVVPRHNDDSKLWVNIFCFNRRGVSQIQDTFYDDVSNGRGGLSLTLDVRANDASLCSVNATAGPRRYVSVLSPRKGLARVSLHCPSGCVPAEIR